MKYYLIAGEASGDLHGSNLMKALRAEDPNAQFRYFGGDLMAAQGGEQARHYSEMSFMGFVEVLMNLQTILGNIKMAKQDILNYKPDALVLIDFPGFNLRIAEFAKSQGIRVCYYISPKIWAWNQKRVHKIKRVVDYMFCILPFEVAFYERFGMKVDYVGNPILDAIAANIPDEQFKLNHDLDVRPVIALLPGSRRQEIEKLLPDMVQSADHLPGFNFVIAGAPGFSHEDYSEIIGSREIKVIFNDTYNLLLHARAAVVTSGTATLETALLRVPQVVVYKGNTLSVAIARMLIKIRFISLVNLIMDDSVVRELIQQECNSRNISTELDSLLNDHLYRTRMLINYDELAQKMGKPGASEQTAKLIVNYLVSK